MLIFSGNMEEIMNNKYLQLDRHLVSVFHFITVDHVGKTWDFGLKKVDK